MADRTELLIAWLEEEGERQRRPLLLTSGAKDLSPRGWVQVGICVIGGALTGALLLCWLIPGRQLVTRLTMTDQLRVEGLRRAVDDPNPSAWSKEEEGTPRRNRDNFGAKLCFGVFAIAFGSVIGALVLRAGCFLYNHLVRQRSSMDGLLPIAKLVSVGNVIHPSKMDGILAGSPGSVPMPAFGKAMAITFVAALVNAIGGFGLLSAVISFLVMAAMISALLPTPFTRGLLVAVCCLLVGLLVVVVLTVVFGGLFLVLAHLR